MITSGLKPSVNSPFNHLRKIVSQNMPLALRKAKGEDVCRSQNKTVLEIPSRS